MKRVAAAARLFDDDDNDDSDNINDRSYRRSSDAPQKRFHAAPDPTDAHLQDINGNDSDEVDPLDAFMAGIAQETAKSTSSASTTFRRRDDLEEEDNIESYINHMKKQGVEVGSAKSAALSSRPSDADDYNSDEEVYAAARAIDAAAAGKNADMAEADETGLKKDIEPLPPVDHSKIEYIEIAKDLYEEHEAITSMSDADVNSMRRQFDMNVTGFGVPKPCVSFAHFGFDDSLISIIARQEFSEPTGIQRQAIPAALSGRDVIGIAKTGSGKTAAYLWPMLVHIMDQPELIKGDGPIGLILAPTRELAGQIYTEAKKYGKAYGLRCSVIYGGASKGDQFKELRGGNGVEIIVATPGRLIDLIKMKATNLRRVSYLVLDEADRMFDLGFEPQVRSICNNVRPDRQTLLFSATFQKRIEVLARDVLTDPVRISIGRGVGLHNEDVTQVVVVLDDDGLKWDWLTQRLAGMVNDGSVIIFVGKKAAVDELAGNLRTHALIECGTLHGDMPQWERDKVIHDMKTGKLKTLVCTDVAARGLDIKQVRNVVNFDTARDIDSHVHRCGRTGRAGEKGTAYTLVTKAEDRFAADLVRNMEESGQPVPPELVDVAMKNSRFRKARTAFGGRDGLRGGSAHRGRGRGRGGIGLSASGGLGGAGRGGRGVGDYNGGGRGFNANLTPVGMTSRSEWKPHSSHITAPVSTFRPSNTIPGAVPISRGGSILSSFQRASSAQGKSTSFVNQSTSNYSSRSPKSN